jgi:hypothetical protein
VKNTVNKRKIFNDPIYGFISVPHEILLELIDHPYFQRLRRIRQLGMAHLVYPGALHTRFHHAMGAMHLMNEAIEVLRSKGHIISDEESEAVCIAILLHDIGHGPFSHALEFTLVKDVHHEDLSQLFMQKLNREFNGRLDLAIKIYANKYKKRFLHQLVSSQLDMDRLDYLKRDSFFTGVSEGVISTDRIIKMLEVHNDELVVEEKGIYSIEKFIVARRLMYWQVYMHKTVVAAEILLINILQRARELASKGSNLFCSPAFHKFLYHRVDKNSFTKGNALNDFAALDDYDIYGAVKVWCNHNDKILSLLCRCFINRRLFKIQLSKKNHLPAQLKKIREKIKKVVPFAGEKDMKYFISEQVLENNAYNAKSDKIHILYRTGEIADIARASDSLNIEALSSPVKKYAVAYLRSDLKR